MGDLMVTLSADVTRQMMQWADMQIDTGMYKSRSELVREMFREKMLSKEEKEMKDFRRWGAEKNEGRVKAQLEHLKSKGLL